MPITEAELGQRLADARRGLELTQGYVADQLDLPRSAISQIENGKRAVAGLELQRLAYLYGKDIRSFLAEQPEQDEPIAALFRSNPELKKDETFAEAVRKCLLVGRELARLESLLGIARNAPSLALYSPPEPRTKSEAVRQGQQVAEQERARLSLGSAPLANVAELLESQSLRTAQLRLPDNVSGLMLSASGIGILVVTNSQDHYVRRRFSGAHEYAHAVLDRKLLSIVSRRGDGSLLEARANAFAAHFLMPAAGVRSQLDLIGKGRRTAKSKRELQLYDVVQLAHHFGASRISVLYQLLNLRLVSGSRFDILKRQDETSGARLSRMMALPQPDDHLEKREFRHRFLGLAIEAFRREEISRGKLHDLGALVEIDRADIDRTLSDLGMEEPDGDEGTVNRAFVKA